MQKKLTTIFSILIILIVVVFTFTPHIAQAGGCNPFLDFDTYACATEVTALIGNILMTVAGFLVTVTAVLLSWSLKITINIKDIYNATDAIRNVWVIIRNLSSIFIIFILIYNSIKTILGMGGAGVQKLIVKIVMAGLLINFSLFFTKIAIDTSNLVSLQFYRVIAPEYASQSTQGWGAVYNDGGLSNILMSSLKIQNIYHPDNTAIKGGSKTGEGTIFLSIVIATYGGVILMLFAAISFLGAAIAFTIRTGILLLLMAFSPIYFAGMIYPEIKKDLSDEWLKYLTNQLFFMPIYLLLMYVALKVISDPGFMSFIQGGSTLTDAADSGSVVKLVGICIQYFIAIIFINVPLIAAIKFGAIGAGFTDKWRKSMVGTVNGFVGQHGVGRLAKKWQEKYAASEHATKNPNFAVLANKALGKTASSTFGGTKGGYEKRFKDYTKERTDFAKKIDLNQGEKNDITNTVVMETFKLDTDIKKTKTEVEEKKNAYNEAVRLNGAERAGDEKAALDAAQKSLEEKENGRKDFEKKRKDELEKQKTNEKRETFAKNLEDDGKKGILAKIVTGSGMTKKARLEVARAVRKEMSKSDNKKMAEKLEKLLEEESKPKEEEKKPAVTVTAPPAP